VRIYPLAADGDSPPGQKLVFCRFTYKLKKNIIHECMLGIIKTGVQKLR